jgi:hypothetical protein
MTTDAELRRRVQERLQAVLDAREKALWRAPGILGKSNTQGNASVTGRDQWCYVRVGNDETLMTAFNNRTSHRNGLPVYVGYDPLQPTLFQVLSERQVYFQEGSGGKSIAPHADQHEWGNTEGGEDVVYARVRQIVDALVFPTDPASLSVTVRDCVYEIEGVVYYYAGGTVDLTAYVPITGYQKYVLIAMGPSGPVVTDGTAKSSVALTDIPTASDGSHWPLAAVWLRYSTTAITDWPDTQHILDLRFTGHMANKGWTNLPGVLIVATSGGQYSDVQDAIDAASAGDVVLVLPGTYTGNVTLADQVSLFGFGPGVSILDGQITCPSGVGDLSISNLKINGVQYGIYKNAGTAADEIWLYRCIIRTNYTSNVVGLYCGVGQFYLYNCDIAATPTVGGYGYGVQVTGAGARVDFYIGQVDAQNTCLHQSSGATMAVGVVENVSGTTSGTITYLFANEILSALLTVDGTGSGLDADTVDGVEAADLATDAELATHAALDSGVHGAGGDTLATDADIATHDADETAHGIEYLIPFAPYNASQSGRTATAYDSATLPFDCTINSFHCALQVQTTNDGSHYWTATLYRRDNTALGSFDTSGIAANTWVRLEDTSLANNDLTAATHLALYIAWTKTGSPGTLLIHTPVAIATK